MVVGILVLELRLQGSRSLKDKRHLVRSLIERARKDFQVGIAEVGDQDLWGNATVCASCPSGSATHAEAVLGKVERLFESHPEVELATVQRDLWRP